MNNSERYENKLNILGKIISQKRLEKNISLEKLSDKLSLLDVNISTTCLHRIENNKRTIRDYELCALIVALDIDINELLLPFINKFKKKI